MSSIQRPVLPAIALLLLGGTLALPTELNFIQFDSFDAQQFIAVLLIFAILAACIERAVEVLMKLSFPKRGPAEIEFRAARSAADANLAIEKQRLNQAVAPQERLEILQNWTGAPLAEKKRLWSVEYQSAKPIRTLCGISFSLIFSGILAANGLLLLSQLIHISVADSGPALESQTLRWVDAVVTAYVLAGGAEWFHEQIKRLNPAGTSEIDKLKADPN